MADDAVHPFPARLRAVEPPSEHESLIAAKAAVRLAVGRLAELSTSAAAAGYARLQADLLDHDPEPAA